MEFLIFILIWTLVSFGIMLLLLKYEAVNVYWGFTVLLPGTLLIFVIIYTIEFYYFIKCKILKQENKYNQRLY